MGALNLLRYKELPIKRGEPSMSDYVIITDTSADIPADILDKGQIHLIPMVYQLNGEECPHRNPGNWDSRERGQGYSLYFPFRRTDFHMAELSHCSG